MHRISRLAIAAMLIGLAACGGSDTATVTDPTTQTDAAPFFQDLEVEWSIERVNNRSYGVRVAFNGNSQVGDTFAEVAYPGYDCIGTWTLIEVDGVEVRARETLTFNPGDVCSDNGLIQLVRSESSMGYQWSYSDGELSDTATLFAG